MEKRDVTKGYLFVEKLEDLGRLITRLQTQTSEWGMEKKYATRAYLIDGWKDKKIDTDIQIRKLSPLTRINTICSVAADHEIEDPAEPELRPKLRVFHCEI